MRRVAAAFAVASSSSSRRQVVRCCCYYRWLHTAVTASSSGASGSGVSEEEAQLLAQLSGALFRDEANALSVPLPEISSSTSGGNLMGLNDDTESWQTQLSSEDCMDAALDPLPQQELHHDELKQGHQLQSENVSSGGMSSFAHAMRSVVACGDSGNASTALAAALCAVMTSEATVANRAVSELLLRGTDVKAVLPDGTLRGVCIEQKCLSQCDFSTLSFLSVRATGVDFSRSLFYASIFHNTVFTQCCFDGCVLKELRCTGNVRFVGCSFRFASIAMRVAASEASTAAVTKAGSTCVVFDRCDFDLADFDGSDRVPARCFVGCFNTDLAAKFPPRTVTA
ncbi:hypothetical protein DQ04_09191010 [Trypanosoma grayi]|uniref:hypothetical protein n=1 Tax=Trypanosoma grayi TaxID=71804 RepID=UPI0004F499C7|nr:hypothetical protein DQ04_09191010 [Trypanosoma grayi]KEG07646.1 hypothetical protein DQ04_09191010 [Trypanosoma grayi]